MQKHIGYYRSQRRFLFWKNNSLPRAVCLVFYSWVSYMFFNEPADINRPRLVWNSLIWGEACNHSAQVNWVPSTIWRGCEYYWEYMWICSLTVKRSYIHTNADVFWHQESIVGASQKKNNTDINWLKVQTILKNTLNNTWYVDFSHTSSGWPCLSIIPFTTLVLSKLLIARC